MLEDHFHRAFTQHPDLITVVLFQTNYGWLPVPCFYQIPIENVWQHLHTAAISQCCMIWWSSFDNILAKTPHQVFKVTWFFLLWSQCKEKHEMTAKDGLKWRNWSKQPRFKIQLCIKNHMNWPYYISKETGRRGNAFAHMIWSLQKWQCFCLKRGQCLETVQTFCNRIACKYFDENATRAFFSQGCFMADCKTKKVLKKAYQKKYRMPKWKHVYFKLFEIYRYFDENARRVFFGRV